MNCIYCHNREANSLDHIPPKCIFTQPLPDNLMTVPCCDICNSSFSKDDQYFMAFLTLIENTEVSSAKDNLFHKLKRIKQRKESSHFYEYLKESIGYKNKITKSGIIIPNQPAIKIDESRIKKVLDRIIKGIVYKSISRLCTKVIIFLDNGPAFLSTKDQSLVSKLVNFAQNVTPVNIGNGDVFSYKFEFPKIKPDFSVSLLRFFKSYYVLGLSQHEG